MMGRAVLGASAGARLVLGLRGAEGIAEVIELAAVAMASDRFHMPPSP